MESARRDAQDGPVKSREVFTLVYAVFIAGVCSIIYELLIATTVSYFKGDSVKYFSLTIGLYMASLGAGAYLSKYFQKNLLFSLVAAETALGFLGALSIPALFFLFSQSTFFMPAYVVLTLAIGFLIGLEIPFLTRILEQYDSLRVSIAHVLALDYLGALIATVAFPFLLLPLFGTFKSGLFFGLLNMSIGLLILWKFPDHFGRESRRLFRGLSVLIALSVIGALVFANDTLKAWNNSVYDGRILYAERTKYQQIVLNKYRDDLRLYLDGNLQFSSIDEYRYHELLVHVPMSYLRAAKGGAYRVLVLGGGDGLAVRELLKFSEVATITLVDIDPAVTRLAKVNPYLRQLNGGSLIDKPNVRVFNKDAFSFLQSRRKLYDLIIADLPDPNNTELARLYTREFYRLVRANLSPDGIFVNQSTSPYFAKKAFWSIAATIASEFKRTLPYHGLVPSFGDWGFVLASRGEFDTERAANYLLDSTRYLDKALFKKIFIFEKDLLETSVEVSTLNRPVILSYYLDGWRNWGR